MKISVKKTIMEEKEVDYIAEYNKHTDGKEKGLYFIDALFEGCEAAKDYFDTEGCDPVGENEHIRLCDIAAVLQDGIGGDPGEWNIEQMTEELEEVISRIDSIPYETQKQMIFAA